MSCVKQVVCYSDGKAKANCDVEMAVDMINFADSFDTCILITGDGDLTYAVDTLVSRGKQVEVVGHKQNTKDTLIHSADRFIDLESIKHLIAKGFK
ncbi:MAG: NYN domain-containing protein [Alphaproteobacteria bacterium]|nr:NYN domain-containing protein [Alphaproteobacteria bacterium]